MENDLVFIIALNMVGGRIPEIHEGSLKGFREKGCFVPEQYNPFWFSFAWSGNYIIHEKSLNGVSVDTEIPKNYVYTKARTDKESRAHREAQVPHAPRTEMEGF